MTDQFDFFGSLQRWPSHERFPYNDAERTVESVVRADLEGARDPLIITGYTSLDRLIDFLARCERRQASEPGHYNRIRFVLGHEPAPSKRTEFGGHRIALSQEVVDYWLSRGISLHLSGRLLAALELIRRGVVEARTSGESAVHAKVYAGDNGITVGSSNFSNAGLLRQVEANVRFTRDELVRFEEAHRAAEVIWSTSIPYTEQLEELLGKMLRVVSWQEALARACAELLEGTWARRYARGPALDEGPQLWPSQQQGIAHALWILENQGSVLIADATGSGKTLMGTHLAKRIINRARRAGRTHNDFSVLLAPPVFSTSGSEMPRPADSVFKPTLMVA